MKINRQNYWKEQGYTEENIQCHLDFERRKSKQSREKRKKNNEVNKEIINTIKKDLLNKTFDRITILSINPTTDGVGFWYKIHKIFNDKSEGDFRYFHHFDDYNKKEFIENLKY